MEIHYQLSVKIVKIIDFSDKVDRIKKNVIGFKIFVKSYDIFYLFISLCFYIVIIIYYYTFYSTELSNCRISSLIVLFFSNASS